MIPDIEALLADYLRGDGRVEAVVGDRVASKSPGSREDPWIRVTKLDDPSAGKSSVDHLITFYVQLDCFAGEDNDRVAVCDLGRLVRELVGEMSKHEHEGAVVTGSKVLRSTPAPDEAFEPTRERYIVTATIWAHSTVAGS